MTSWRILPDRAGAVLTRPLELAVRISEDPSFAALSCAFSASRCFSTSALRRIWSSFDTSVSCRDSLNLRAEAVWCWRSAPCDGPSHCWGCQGYRIHSPYQRLNHGQLRTHLSGGPGMLGLIGVCRRSIPRQYIDNIRIVHAMQVTYVVPEVHQLPHQKAIEEFQCKSRDGGGERESGGENLWHVSTAQMVFAEVHDIRKIRMYPFSHLPASLFGISSHWRLMARLVVWRGASPRLATHVSSRFHMTGRHDGSASSWLDCSHISGLPECSEWQPNLWITCFYSLRQCSSSGSSQSTLALEWVKNQCVVSMLFMWWLREAFLDSLWAFFVPLTGTIVNMGLLSWKRHTHPWNMILLSTFNIDMRPIIVAMFIGLMLFTLQIKFAKGVLADVHPKYNLFGMGTRHSLLCNCDLVTNKWIEQARLGPCSSQLTLTDLYIGNMEHLDLPEAIGSLPYMELPYMGMHWSVEVSWELHRPQTSLFNPFLPPRYTLRPFLFAALIVLLFIAVEPCLKLSGKLDLNDVHPEVEKADDANMWLKLSGVIEHDT
ncbi:hypothetical protein B0H17DRAFT_1128534 [Mycena rosella]|uniref:Uncharacterized protein n=1 Tax=Mycena rosella TaxID=1033263 RepID=A0AAD7DXN6_MYCRO|nr:hypothetical protein B0H17DRAFT_1128534 [Mycena rosella]